MPVLADIIKQAEESGADPIQVVRDCLNDDDSRVSYREAARIVERHKAAMQSDEE